MMPYLRIEEKLENVEQYTNVDGAPITDYNKKIKEWADKGLEKHEIDGKMYNFVKHKD
jgi:hypothetical protein